MPTKNHRRERRNGNTSTDDELSGYEKMRRSRLNNRPADRTDDDD